MRKCAYCGVFSHESEMINIRWMGTNRKTVHENCHRFVSKSFPTEDNKRRDKLRKELNNCFRDLAESKDFNQHIALISKIEEINKKLLEKGVKN